MDTSTFARTKSAILLAFFLVVIAGPAALFACEHAGLDLPSWLTAEDATYLAGGGEANVADNLTLESFEDGELQQAVEGAIANHYPMKALAMMGHAATEEWAIQASNLLFHYPLYESFYGSGLVYYPAEDAIVQLPQEGYDDTSGWSEFASRLAAFAERHPEKRFVVYLVAEWYDDDINPLYELVSTDYEVHKADEQFSAELADVPNVTLLYQDYQSPDEYYENHFQADHHQTIQGAVHTYNRIAAELDLETLEEQELKAFDIPYLGSYARSSLKDIEETPYDLEEDFSELTLVEAERSFGADEHGNYESAPDELKKTDFYGQYSEYAPMAVEGGSGTKDALLVCDSHGAVMFRLLGSAYRRLAISHAFYYAAENDTPLAELLAQDDAEDVIFIANLVDYKTFCERNPQFFEE